MAPQAFKWNDLVVELQLKVLEHRLVFSRPITKDMHDSIVRRALLPLALTSKHLHQLATQTYYKQNTFVIRPEARFSKGPKPHPKQCFALPHPNPAISHRIRLLELHFTANVWGGASSLEAMLGSTRCYLSRLLVPNRQHPLYIPDLVQWQRNFSKLKYLKLVLTSGDSCPDVGHYIIDPGWQGECHVRMRAAKAEVSVESPEGYGRLCRPCAERVEGIFKDMLMIRSHEGLSNSEERQMASSFNNLLL